jgi:peptidoglycan/LPS O-acetylase OafA/YrhL
VQVFFVLSGFLLALPYVKWRAGSRSRPQTLPYLARRCARVLPGYYVQLILLLGLVWWQGKPWPINGVGDVLGYLAMLMLPEPWGIPLLNGVWWTLPIEFSFYLVVPLLGVLLDRRRGWALLVLSICAMSLWCWWVITDIAAAQRPGARHWLGYQLPGSLDSFGLGMIAALALPLCAALAVAVAALSWHWLEQPVIAWVRRVRARRAR